MSERPGSGPQASGRGDPMAASRWLRTENVLLVALAGILVWITEGGSAPGSPGSGEEPRIDRSVVDL